MKYFNKFIITTIYLSYLLLTPLMAVEKTAFVDVEYLIQNSNIGKRVLANINDLNNENIKLLKNINKDLKELESKINNKKNIISEQDFNDEVKIFQKKVKDSTIKKNEIVKEFNNFQKEELKKVISAFNPIISNYMKQNSFNILLDSKNVFMGNSESNKTEVILKLINDKIS